MRLKDALELFEISDLSTETDESLKSKFRTLTKKYHPDNNRTSDHKKFLSVNEAYTYLKDMLAKLSQYKALNQERTLYTVLIPLDKLVDIYGGGHITFGSASEQIQVNKSEMKKNNSLIISEVSIEHNGIVNVFDNIQRWNIDDNYSVNCNIYVDNISNTEKIKIKVLDKELELDMTYSTLNIKFTLSYNINVSVIVSKKIIVNNENA